MTESNRLIGQAERVSHAAPGGACDDFNGLRFKGDSLITQDTGDVVCNCLGGNVLQLKLQTARQYGDRDFFRIRRRQQKLHMLRRLLQRFQQRVEAGNGKHMHFVNEVDLVAATRRHVLGVFQQVSGVVDTGTRRSVYLDQIDEAVLFHLDTYRAFAAGRRADTALAVKALGQYACDGRLTHTTSAGEQIGVVQAVMV